MSVIEKNGFVEDGNHRIAIAELLYSSDKKVPCIYKTVIQRWNIKDEIEFHENEEREKEEYIRKCMEM